MGFYPINIDISGKPAVVIGGGAVAERKVQVLLEFGAEITIVSPEITQNLKRLTESGTIKWHARVFELGDLDGARIAFAATNDREVNQEIFKEAEAKGVLLNCVDQPDLCHFTVSSLVKRGDLLIAISTGGQSPALAAWVRRNLEKRFGEEYAKVTDIVGAIRRRIIDAGKSTEEYKDKFEKLLSSDLVEKIRASDEEGIKREVLSIFGEGWL